MPLHLTINPHVLRREAQQVSKLRKFSWGRYYAAWARFKRTQSLSDHVASQFWFAAVERCERLKRLAS